MKSLRERLEEQLKIQEKQQQELIRIKEIEVPIKTKIEVRITEDEKEVIKSMARLNHMNVSEFVRYLVFNRYANELIKDNGGNSYILPTLYKI